MHLTAHDQEEDRVMALKVKTSKLHTNLVALTYNEMHSILMNIQILHLVLHVCIAEYFRGVFRGSENPRILKK